MSSDKPFLVVNVAIFVPNESISHSLCHTYSTVPTIVMRGPSTLYQHCQQCSD